MPSTFDPQSRGHCCHHLRGTGKLCSSFDLAQAAAQGVAEFALDFKLPLPATMAKPLPIVGRSAIGVAFSEAARNWPFVFGFAVTMGLVTWMSQNLDPKDAQKSPFINPTAHR